MYWSPLEHLYQVCLMGVLILGAQALARRIQRERLRNEARGLRCGLIISLQALRDLYADNLRVLAGARPPLMSGRQQINLLRIFLGRVVSLEQSEIEAVITACIAMERAESAMAVVRKRVAVASFAVPQRGDRRALLESVLLHTCSLLDVAADLLNPERGRRDEGAIKVPLKADIDADEVHGANTRGVIESDRAGGLNAASP